MKLRSREQTALLRYPRRPATRQSYLVLNAPISTTAASATDLSFRTLARLPIATSRWRIGFANHNVRNLTIPTTPCTITGVYTGTPVYGTTSTGGARWAGAATGALSQVSTSITVPTDGTTGWSPWVSDSASQFSPFTEKVLGWGHTHPASGTGLGTTSAGYQTYFATGSSQAANATLTSPTLGTTMYLDVFIEYEFATTGQIGLFIGDSNTFGVAVSAPPLFPSSGSGALPYEAWPTVAGELAGFSAVNLGVGSTTLVDYASGFPGLWTRVDLTSVSFDFAVVSLGTNGLNSSQGNFDNFVSYIRSINTQIRALGIKRIYWTEITPRGFTTSASTLSASVSAAATTFQTPVQLSFDDGNSCGLLGSDTNGEFFTVTSTTPTGTGPYTYTLTAGCAFAHAAGDQVTAGKESSRRRINAWLRNLPDGISGVIPFELAFEASPQSASPDPRLVCSDLLHFIRGAGMVRAAQSAISGLSPKLT